MGAVTLFSRSYPRWRSGLQNNLQPQIDSGVCATCLHYHRYPTGACSPYNGCVCMDTRRLTVDEADKLGVGWA